MGYSSRDISCGTLRGAVSQLIEEGWTAEKKKSNHIRLSHPLAPRFVFTSSTPSDFRSSQNLLSECRGVLKEASTEKKGADSSSEVSEESIMEALRESRQMKRSKRREKRKNTFTPLPVISQSVTAQSATPTKEVAREAVKSLATPSAPEEAQKEKAVEVQDVLKPQIENQNKSVEGQEPVSVKSLEKETVIIAPKPSVPDVAPDLMVEATEVVNVGNGLETLSADVLRIAMAIASGELKQMIITQDMVGGTLLYEGNIRFVPSETPKVMEDQKVALREAWVKPSNKSRKVQKGVTESVFLDLLGNFKGYWMNMTEIADILWEDYGYKDLDSCKNSISRFVRPMLLANLITRKQIDGVYKYHIV